MYLNAYHGGKATRIGLGNYFSFYNTEHPRQALSYRTPAEVFTSIPVEATNGDVVEALTPDPLRIAGLTISIALGLEEFLLGSAEGKRGTAIGTLERFILKSQRMTSFLKLVG